VCLSVEEVARPFSNDHRHSWAFKVDTFVGDSCESNTAIQDLFETALERLPVPVRHPINAKHYVTRRFGTDFRIDGIRGSSFGTSIFEVSSRAVIDYISGRINRPEFERLIDDLSMKVLRNGLDQGRLPVEIKLNRGEPADDDTIVIQLGEPDAAVASFRT
jgi:hypothetical protein